MRVLVVAVGLLVLSAPVADARSRARTGPAERAEPTERRTQQPSKQRQVATTDAARPRARTGRALAHRDDRTKSRRVAITDDIRDRDRRGRPDGDRDRGDRAPRGQSLGAPWNGALAGGTRLRIGDGAFIRRPQRAFGTRTTVEHVRRAINDTLDAFPRAHVLAIGDLSAREGGWITEHQSHQSGRDVDLGLFFKRRPPGYPASFVVATAETLHHAATWALLSNLVATQDEDGGVHMIFLDFEVQGMLYHWALDRGISARRLDRIFQYPHGRGASAGIVRHEPNHADHLHVRFRCARADTTCR